MQMDFVDKDFLYEILRKMILIRKFEEKVLELFEQGKLSGTTHVCIGEEAVAVGACSALEVRDFTSSYHRGHGHFIAKGGDVYKMMAELFGKKSGYSNGKGGSQHMGDLSIGHLGSNGITGGNIPIATGASLALKMKHQKNIVLCFFGDGACNQGTFHESLNIAAIWRLPILYLCENNQYAMSANIRDMVRIENLADRGKAYGIPSEIADGNDVLEVYQKVKEARRRILDTSEPHLLECKTYRLMGHSKSDSCTYRTKLEEQNWWEKEPIGRFARYMKGLNIINQKELHQLERQAEAMVVSAVQKAENEQEPKIKEATVGIYATDLS